MIITIYCKNLKSMQDTLARLYQVENKNPLDVTEDLKIKLSKNSGITCESIPDFINEITEEYWLKRTQVYFEQMYESMLRDDKTAKTIWTEEEDRVVMRKDLNFNAKAKLLDRSAKSVMIRYFEIENKQTHHCQEIN